MTPKLPDDQKATEKHWPPLRDEALTREVIGAYYKVYNTLGYGFFESVYSNALYIELQLRGLKVQREVAVIVRYEGHRVGRYKIDQLVEDRLVLEITATRLLPPEDRDQLLNALCASELELGLLLHFGPRPKFFRVIAENSRKTHNKKTEPIEPA